MYIYNPTEDSQRGRNSFNLGGKGANLARLVRLGVKVPRFYIISTNGHEDFLAQGDLHDELGELLSMLDRGGRPEKIHASIEQMYQEHPLPGGLRSELRELLDVFGDNALVSVRSSAQDEDGAVRSFAGMLSSYLYVHGQERVEDAVKRCWASALTPRCIAYMQRLGLSPQNVRVAVVVQEMVDPDAAGVAFSVDPVTGDPDKVVVDAVLGAGEGLVSGALDADHFVWSRDTKTIMAQRISCKASRLGLDVEKGWGLCSFEVEQDKREAASVDPKLVERIARTAMSLEEKLGGPQDIEWAAVNDELFVLQARPVTSLPMNKNVKIWDNANITESYGGITLPLTFSIIKDFYYVVFRETLRGAGVSSEILAKIDRDLRNMLGLIEGRVYYNLLSWYNIIFVLPALRHYKVFWEQMIGLRQTLPDWAREALVFSEDEMTLEERLFKVKLGAGLLWKYLRFEDSVRGFCEHVEDVYDRYVELPFETSDVLDLVQYYRQLEEILLGRWREPNVNDFYCFLFTGLLSRLTSQWLGPKSNLHNDLLAGEKGVISFEPAARLTRMAREIAKDQELAKRVMSDSPQDVLRHIRSEKKSAPVAKLLDSYIRDFGFRSLEELKFESPDLYSNPEMLIVMLRNCLRAGIDRAGAAAQTSGELRRAAEKELARHLSGHKLKIYRMVLKAARKAMARRENTRFLRSKMYGLIRRILVGIGNDLSKKGLIAAPRDVFYLTKDELFSMLDGTSVTRDLKGLVELRKKEYAGFEKIETDDRIVTRGLVYFHNDLFGASRRLFEGGDELQGISAGTGKVTGPIKVIMSAHQDLELAGEILVAKRTDPGWVTLFPSISGLLVEKGSLMSHSIIVAREMGIPTVVGIERLTERLSDGDVVSIDAAAGVVLIEEKYADMSEA